MGAQRTKADAYAKDGGEDRRKHRSGWFQARLVASFSVCHPFSECSKQPLQWADLAEGRLMPRPPYAATARLDFLPLPDSHPTRQAAWGPRERRHSSRDICGHPLGQAFLLISMNPVGCLHMSGLSDGRPNGRGP